MTQDKAKRFARDRALPFDESHPMTLCRPTAIIWNLKLLLASPAFDLFFSGDGLFRLTVFFEVEQITHAIETGKAAPDA